MADIDLNDIATAAIATLQDSIDALNGMIGKPGADDDGIETKIEALEDKQTAVRDMTLGVIQATDANKAAIAAVTAAAAALDTEAKTIGDVATALTAAAKVVGAAASLITALAPFL